MKRDARLAALSRDHHQTLVIAQALKRALPETAAAAREAFLGFWHVSGREHFRLEEEVLLPAYAAHGDAHHPVVARVLCEHVAIRRHADELRRDPAAPVAALQALGRCMADHVRFEERELFPLIEQAMPDDALNELADALGHAEGVEQGREMP